ncbi:RNA-binding domain-containing protein, partial [Paraprevotella clara]
MSITKDYIRGLLGDLENDSVERTISTTNTDKFGQAICAFANDLPCNNHPGYLIIGAEDDGSLHPIHVTDELLKNIAGIRTDGNIQPQPSMTVQKLTFPEGDIVVVEVYPTKMPPVKYKGRIWVRIGPRKGVANEDDERRLYEKRVANIKTFDAMPCIGATVDDLDIAMFRQLYLPKAVPEDVLREDGRDVELQLQSLGFFDKRYGCPTYAGILFFGKQVERFLPGAYIQYVRFGGKGRESEVKSEYKFAGNLCEVLFRLDTFVDTSIINRRPVPISALREKTLMDYPHWATRELLMNAICHRTYESNGPIQFYQYNDRIELMNPGGLYGKVNAQNFPFVNDYRNPVIAEAMKVLGFVNRFSRGIIRVKEELKENGNGEPEFSLDLGTAFLVVEPISAEALKYYPSEEKSEEKSEE